MYYGKYKCTQSTFIFSLTNWTGSVAIFFLYFFQNRTISSSVFPTTHSFLRLGICAAWCRRSSLFHHQATMSGRAKRKPTSLDMLKDPGHWTFCFIEGDLTKVVSVVVPWMLAVLPYARGRGFDSRSRLLKITEMRNRDFFMWPKCNIYIWLNILDWGSIRFEVVLN
jgi:hypothetical protein